MSDAKLYPAGLITWDFVVTEQLKVSRYGHMGQSYYKQFTPYGLELPDRHPPQRISLRTYEMASRLHVGQPVKLP